jgi:Zn-dependent protease with chaperone function
MSGPPLGHGFDAAPHLAPAILRRVQVLMLIDAGLLAAIVTFTINWLALIPWRRAKDQHWTERARLCYPARVAAGSNLWILPAILTMSVLLLWPDDSPHWIFMLLATAAGAVVGTLPMSLELFPQIPLKDLFRLTAAHWLMRFAVWLIFFGTIAVMPGEFTVRGFIIAAMFVILCYLWSHNGWIWTERKLGLFVPPPERLQNIVRNTAGAMNVPVREFWVMRSSGSQAFALPATRTLLFTDRMLAVLSDDELAAVCAHELAHLTEAKTEYYKRYIQWLTFLPWLFFKPIVHVCGVFGYVILLLISTMAPRVYRDISRKLEVRADEMAKAQEHDPGTYARALARIYQDNMVPAVTAGRGTHPHLYDRLVAAGVTPDFPRPAAAKLRTWYGSLLSWLLAFLAMALVIKYTNQ